MNINSTSSLCIICQRNISKDEAVTVTERGSSTLKRSANARKNKIDPKNEEATARILSTNEFKYHRTCYATYTSNTNISRLADPTTDENYNLQPSAANGDNSEEACEVDWTKCILCQQVMKHEKDLRNVKSAGMEATIKCFANIDETLSCRIARGSIQLIELAKYHLSCLNLYQAKMRKGSASVSKSHQNTALSSLISNLRSDGNEGKVRRNFIFLSVCRTNLNSHGKQAK